MSQGLGPQGGFRAPRVPLDLRCVILAAMGYLAVLGVDWLLAWAFSSQASPIAQVIDLIGQQLDYVAFLGKSFRKAMQAVWGEADNNLSAFQSFVTAVCFLTVWSLFGAAVLRTAALKLTRDEPLSIKESLRFGVRNWMSFLMAPVLVILFAGFFAACNALAGLVFSLHFVGSSLLILPLFPLVLIASLLVVLAIMGGVVGLPLMWAGLAVEQNGPLEALSRAYSYIFARPFRFFFSYFLLFVVMGILLLASQHFERTVKETTKLGVVRDSFDDAIAVEAPSEEDVLKDPSLKGYTESERGKREMAGIARLENVNDVSWYDWLGFLWMWLCLGAFLLGFKGYALYLFLGGTTSLYLNLRRDVDGTDEEEIYPESEDDFALPESEPRWVAPQTESPEAGADAKESDEKKDG